MKDRLEDKELRDWADAVREVKPYSEPAKAPPAPPEESPDEGPARPQRAYKRPAIDTISNVEKELPLEVGAYRSIDKRTAERMRKGRQQIDAMLDLHGMRQAEACEAFYRFIQHHQAIGSRCVLVITGQGRRSGEGAVLQQALPRWANEPLLRPFIVALDYATPKQGGKGAYSIYLRRTRQRHE